MSESSDFRAAKRYIYEPWQALDHLNQSAGRLTRIATRFNDATLGLQDARHDRLANLAFLTHSLIHRVKSLASRIDHFGGRGSAEIARRADLRLGDLAVGDLVPAGGPEWPKAHTPEIDLAIDLFNQAIHLHELALDESIDQVLVDVQTLSDLIAADVMIDSVVSPIQERHVQREAQIQTHRMNSTVTEASVSVTGPSPSVKIQALATSLPPGLPWVKMEDVRYDWNTSEIIVKPGDTPGSLSTMLTEKSANWKILFPHFVPPMKLQVGRHLASPEAKKLIEQHYIRTGGRSLHVPLPSPRKYEEIRQTLKNIKSTPYKERLSKDEAAELAYAYNRYISLSMVPAYLMGKPISRSLAKRYMSGKGGVVELSYGDIKNDPAVKNANLRAIHRSLKNPVGSSFFEDAEFGNDLSTAIGSNKIQYSIEYKGPGLYGQPVVVVSAVLDDQYTFSDIGLNEGFGANTSPPYWNNFSQTLGWFGNDVYDQWMHDLELYGHAKSFTVRVEWSMRITILMNRREIRVELKEDEGNHFYLPYPLKP